MVTEAVVNPHRESCHDVLPKTGILIATFLRDKSRKDRNSGKREIPWQWIKWNSPEWSVLPATGPEEKSPNSASPPPPCNSWKFRTAVLPPLINPSSGLVLLRLPSAVTSSPSHLCSPTLLFPSVLPAFSFPLVCFQGSFPRILSCNYSYASLCCCFSSRTSQPCHLSKVLPSCQGRRHSPSWQC